MKTNWRSYPVAWLSVSILLVPALSRAETAVEAWVQYYNGPGNSADTARDIAVDGNHNVIVAGWSSGTSADYATIKYSGAGVPLWTNRYNGPGNTNDAVSAIVADGSNNVIVTGTSDGGGNEPYSNPDFATIKYSSAGVPLWTNRFGAWYDVDNSYAVAVDASNSVFVAGSSRGDYTTIKYSSAGAPLWTNRYSGPPNGLDEAYAVTVDGSNNVIVTGYSDGSGTSVDYATIKYSSAGMPLWTNRFNGSGNSYDQPSAIAVDGSNNVFVTGYSWDSDQDYVTIKYSSAGVPLWTNRYNGPMNDWDKAVVVKADGSGNVIVTGYSIGNGSTDDYATIKYSAAGMPLWTNRYNGPANYNDRAWDMVVDDNSNVIVTGSSRGNGSSDDYVTIKYSSAGVPLWTNRFNGLSNGLDAAHAVAVDGSNNVIVTGWAFDTLGHYDFATVKYVCIPDIIPRMVTTTNDAGAGSLRQAIADANSGDTINFSVTGTIVLTNGDLSACKNLIIVGPGTTNLTLSGNHQSRILYVCTNTTVTLQGLTLANGYSTNGGGIYNDGGTVKLVDCVLRNNIAGSTAQSARGGAIYNCGVMTVTNSWLDGNSCSGSVAPGSAEGGACFNATNSVLDVVSSAFTSNEAIGGASAYGSPDSGGLAEGGALANSGVLHLRNVTVTENAVWGGNGWFIPDPYSGTLPGEAYGGGICSRGNLTLTNCTIAWNDAYWGSGIIFVQVSGAGVALHGGQMMTKNSIIAHNLTGQMPSFDNIWGSGVLDVGCNLSYGVSYYLTNATSISALDASLGPLGNYGGPTPTIPLLYGSPAINAGDTAAAPPTDQRGFPRPIGSAADIGAFEWGAAPSTPPRFTSCRLLTNSLMLQLSGELGRVFEIHTSSNLTQWDWLVTLTNNSGAMQYTNTGVAGHPARFYKVVQLP